MLISSKQSILFVILILFSLSDTSSGLWNTRVQHEFLAKNSKNNFQPTTTTTEKPSATEKMTFDKFPQSHSRVRNKFLAKNLENNFQPSTTTTEKSAVTEEMTFDKYPESNSYHIQKDCFQKCIYTRWIFSLCSCLYNS